MRSVTLFVAGMAASLFAGRLLSGCCAGETDVVRVGSGTYNVYTDGADAANPQDSDYELVVNADRTALRETFTRGGRHYEIQYQVVDHVP